MMTLPFRTLGVALAGMSIVVLGPIQQSVAARATIHIVPQHRVSATFVNAPVEKVLDWLAKQDANFVVSNTSVPTGLKLTLHFSSQPLPDVEAAIASAMGGVWRKENGILVFAKGSKLPFVISDGNLKTFDLPKGQFNFDKQFGPDFQKQMQGQFGPEFQERIEKQFGPDFQKQMQGQFGPEFQKKLQDEVQEIQREAQKAQAEALKSQQDMLKSQGNVKRAQEDALRAEKMQRLNYRLSSSQDLAGLLDSLTDSQKELMKSRRYLKVSDLTERQKKMLGEFSGKFEIAYGSDKGSFRVKSDE